jgi:hypothetical protein
VGVDGGRVGLWWEREQERFEARRRDLMCLRLLQLSHA